MWKKWALLMRDRYNKLIHSGFVVDFLISYVTFLYRLG